MHRAALPGNPGIPELYRKRLTVRKICKILLSKKIKLTLFCNFFSFTYKMTEWMRLVLEMKEKHHCSLKEAMHLAKRVYKKK